MGEAAGAGMGLILLIPIIIWIGFMLSLNKLVNVVRTDSLPQTFVSKVWVWTQIIPIWGFIALVVFNIKADAAVRALETKLDLPFKTISYPATIGWIVILGALYVWIPIVGTLALIICMVLYWVKVSATSKQIESLKVSKLQEENIN